MRHLLRSFIFILLVCALLLGAAYYFLPLPGNPTVLMYHFIGTQEHAEQSNNFVSEESFEKQMKFLKEAGYRLLSLEEFYEIITGLKPSKGKEILITFDDGDYSFETKALPVLTKYQIPASVFVVSENIKQGLHGSMSQTTIQNLLRSGLITLGGHSKTHPYLTQRTDQELVTELETSKREMEVMFNRKMPDLAYPYGDFDKRVKEAAISAGYRMAFTTSHKKRKDLPADDRYAITRTKITKSSDSLPLFWVKVSGLYSTFKGLRHQLKGNA